MDVNRFGRVSALRLCAGQKDGKTHIEDMSFTAPFKVMFPFEKKNKGLRVMLMTASAGIMEGDRQEFDFKILPGAELEFISQSYDKVHQMNEGCAKRVTAIDVASHGMFYYDPQPMIPFKDSAFESEMYVNLENETSGFWLSEILSCGRYARGESFEYRYYRNLVEIRRGGKLIYRDNARFEPSCTDMSDMGMYEGYTHLLNLFVTRPRKADEFTEGVHKCLEAAEKCEGGITELMDGSFAVRAFGKKAQSLEELGKQIKELHEKSAAS